MRRPQHPDRESQARSDRLEDVASAVHSLRKAVAQGNRIAIETFCWTLARRLAAAPVEPDDADEICATIGLVEARAAFGVHERLRRFLLPLVAAIERQIEEAERDL